MFILDWFERCKAAWEVLLGSSIAVPVGIPNTVVVYSVASRNSVKDGFIVSSLKDESSYAVDLSQLYAWVNSKQKHYWTATELGIQVMTEANRAVPREKFAESGDVDL